MPVRGLSRNSFTVALALTLLALPASAHADTWLEDREEASSGRTEGSIEGETISARAGIDFDPPPGEQEGKPLVTGAGSSWTPPACYYAPRWSPEEFKDHWEGKVRPTAHKDDHSGYGRIASDHKNRYGEDGELVEHGAYNLEREGDGMWWTTSVNLDSPDLTGRQSCNRPTFWVDFNDPPPDQPGVPDPEMLAALAYEQLRVPETEFQLNPDGVQTVNLATWIWAQDTAFTPVSVTASIPDWDLWATTTATPTTLRITPGTENADLHPTSGECAIDPNGNIGEPYAKGKTDQTPPCGLTYRRATHHTSDYPLSVSISWNVTWEGSNNNEGTLPTGTHETTHNLTVEEIQTIIR